MAFVSSLLRPDLSMLLLLKGLIFECAPLHSLNSDAQIFPKYPPDQADISNQRLLCRLEAKPRSTLRSARVLARAFLSYSGSGHLKTIQ